MNAAQTRLQVIPTLMCRCLCARCILRQPHLTVSGSWSVEVLLGTNVSIHPSVIKFGKKKATTTLNLSSMKIGTKSQLLKGQTGTWEPSIQSAWCIDLRCPLAIQGAPQGPGVLASLGSFTEVQNFRLCPRPTDQDLPFHKLLG